jgi:hypothetical protein
MSRYDKRIQIELQIIENEGGKVTILEPYHFILEMPVKDEIVKLDVDLRDIEDKTKLGFPNAAPLVYVLSPFVFQADIRMNWGPTIKLLQIFTFVDPMIQRMKEQPVLKEVSKSLQTVIDVAKATPGPLWLVIGSHPGEAPRGRTMYNNKQIFFLDKNYGTGPNANRSFEMDMTDPTEMGILARELPNRFQKICFDESVTKFFTPYSTIESQRDIYYVLKSFYTMLTEDGILFIAEPGSIRGGIITLITTWNQKLKPDPYPHPGSIFTPFVESAGFHTKKMIIDEIDDPLVKLVHKDAKDGGSRTFLVCQKKPFAGGRRRKYKTRQRKLNRKHKTMRHRR